MSPRDCRKNDDDHRVDRGGDGRVCEIVCCLCLRNILRSVTEGTRPFK